MNDSRQRISRLQGLGRGCALMGLLASILAAPSLVSADSGEVGNVCVQDLQGGSTNCSSGVFSFPASIPAEAIDGCSSSADTALVRFDLEIANGSSNRNDIGIFVALDGGDALTGDNCLHDYLDPPLTTTPVYTGSTVINGPWYDQDGDSCGDIEFNTEVIKTIPSASTTLEVACTDTDANGFIDLDVCAGGRGVSGDLQCDSLEEAWPQSGAQCSCARVNLDVSAGPTTTTTGPTVTTTTVVPTTTTTTLPELCSEVPRAGCQNSNPQSSRLILHRNVSNPSRDRLVFTWESSAAVSNDDLGDPTLVTSYDVCIYSGGVDVLSSVVPADGNCQDGACWRTTTTGYRFNGEQSTSEGVKVMTLTSGPAAGQGRIVVKGRGPLLELPNSVMLAAPVLFQVVRRDALSVCWEATFSTSLQSNPERFKANSD